MDKGYTTEEKKEQLNYHSILILRITALFGKSMTMIKSRLLVYLLFVPLLTSAIALKPLGSSENNAEQTQDISLTLVKGTSGKAQDKEENGILLKIPADHFIYGKFSGEAGSATVLFQESKQKRNKQKNINASLSWPSAQSILDKNQSLIFIYRNEVLLKFKPSFWKDAAAINSSKNFILQYEICTDQGNCNPNGKKITIPDKLDSAQWRTAPKVFSVFEKKFPITESMAKEDPNNPLKIIKTGWDKKPLPGKELNFSILFHIDKSRLPDLSKENSTKQKNIPWQRCRLQPFATGSNNLGGWEFARPALNYRGETPQSIDLHFSLPLLSPEDGLQFTQSDMRAVLSCPGAVNAIELKLDTKDRDIIAANSQDRSDWNEQSEKTTSNSDAKEKSTGFLAMLSMLFFAFVGGLILNVMPCVLPVISIKIFSLIKQAGEEKKTIFRFSLLFVFGVLTTFLLLAFVVIVLKSFGENIGWGFQFQSPIFLIVLAVILLVFGLSLFNVFSFNIPQTGGLGKLAMQGGPMGSYFQGVLATILATPCSAPFLGSAMGFAFSQGSLTIFLIFLFAGLGMALPYFILALFPQAIKYLPKPGEWMETLKQFMGFLLFGTLLWMLWILSRMLGSEGLIDLMIYLFALSLLIWLGGRFAPIGTNPRKFYTVWLMLVLLGAAVSWKYIPQITAYRGQKGEHKAEIRTGKISWKSFSPDSFGKLRRENKIIFLKFTADWCLTCKVNEKTVLSTDAVYQSFQKYNAIPVSADWTNGDAEITKLLNSFGRSGVPFYVVYPAGEARKAIPLSEVITPGTIEEALKQAAQTR